MNDRRDFLKKSLFVAGGLAFANTRSAFAATGKFQAGIVYTKDNPGKWAKKVGSHAPKVKVEGKKVTLTTMHPMSEKHYIVRHTLVALDGKVLGERTFYPSDKKAESAYELPVKKGTRIFATSFCNKHDLWVTEFSAS